jgi:hypothetical protein
LSYFSPPANNIVAAPPRLSTEQPGSKLDEGELALRVYKNINGNEWALYGYHGYFTTPVAFNPKNGLNYFPNSFPWALVCAARYRVVSPTWKWSGISPKMTAMVATLLGGKGDYTFFAQFEENSSFFARLRYSF